MSNAKMTTNIKKKTQTMTKKNKKNKTNNKNKKTKKHQKKVKNNDNKLTRKTFIKQLQKFTFSGFLMMSNRENDGQRM